MSAKPVSRRQLLISSAIVAAGGVLAACGAPAAPAPTAAPAKPAAPAAPAAAAPTTAAAPAAAAPTTAAAPAAAAPTTAAAPAVKTSPSGVFRYAIDNDTETRKPVVEAFLAKNYPNVKAQFEVTPAGYFEKLLSQIAAKNPPDLAYLHESRFLDFASQGALQPLDDYMAKQPLIDGNDKYPLETLKPNNNYKGKWYAMPIGMGYLFVRYNKTMFDKVGVPVPTDKWTWDDMKGAAAKLTQESASGTSKQWGWIGWDPGWMPSWWPLMQSYGAYHFSPDLSQAILNNADGVKVLDFMRSTWADKITPTPAAKTQLASGTIKLFEGGLAAMDSVLSPNVISSLKNIGDKFEMGIEMFPSGPKGQFVRTGGSSMSIPVGAKNPDLAWEVLRHMIGDEQANKDAATYLDGNPLLRLDYTLKYNVPSRPLADKMKSIMTEGFSKHGTVVQYAPIGEYSSIVTATVDKLAAGEMTAQQAADDIVAQANKLIKEKAAA